MTDYWSRPGSSGQPDFEIQLIGEEGSLESSAPRHAGAGPAAHRWGVIAGVTALGAIALVVAASVVIQVVGDDGEQSAEPVSTTLPLDPAAPVSTAPTETAAVGALGEFDMPETRYVPTSPSLSFRARARRTSAPMTSRPPSPATYPATSRSARCSTSGRS